MFPIRPERGYTLIELMIALVVVGVLAAVAIPVYRNDVARAKISEGLVLAMPLKTAVARYYAIHGALPSAHEWHNILAQLGMNHGAAGAASGRYVKRVYWHNDAASPAIEIRYVDPGVPGIDNKLLALEADFSGASISWQCEAPAAGGVAPRYLPASCQN